MINCIYIVVVWGRFVFVCLCSIWKEVAGIIFTAALNHYDRVLFENESCNGMHESIFVFSKIINLRWLRGTTIILLFTKYDLFVESLKDEISLDACFGKENVEWRKQSKHIWNGPNYHKLNENGQEDEKSFENCCQKAQEFIQECYLSQRNNLMNQHIYTHVTSAMDQNNIKTIFDSVHLRVQRKLMFPL